MSLKQERYEDYQKALKMVLIDLTLFLHVHTEQRVYQEAHSMSLDEIKQITATQQLINSHLTYEMPEV